MSTMSWRNGELLPDNPIEENNDKLGQLIGNKTVHPINSFPLDLHWNCHNWKFQLVFEGPTTATGKKPEPSRT